MNKGFSADFDISAACGIPVVGTNIFLPAPDPEDSVGGPPKLRIIVAYLAKAAAFKVRFVAVDVAEKDAVCHSAVLYCCISIWVVQFVVRVVEEVGVECSVEIVPELSAELQHKL